jgi:hypothetical protein
MSCVPEWVSSSPFPILVACQAIRQALEPEFSTDGMLKLSCVATLELVLAHQQYLEPTILPTDPAGLDIEGEPVAETGIHQSSHVDGTDDLVAGLELEWSPGYREFEALDLTELPAHWNGSCDFLVPPILPQNDQVFEFTPPSVLLDSANQTSVICDGGLEISESTRVEL